MIPWNFPGGTKQNKQLCVANRVKSLCANFGLNRTNIKKITEEEANLSIHNFKKHQPLYG